MTTAAPRRLNDDMRSADRWAGPDRNGSGPVPVPIPTRGRPRRVSRRIDGVSGRVRAAVRAEVEQLRLGLIAGSSVARLLPAHTAHRTRAAVLRASGLVIGRGTVIAGALRIAGTSDPRDTLRIGAHGFVNTGCHIDASGEVTIGDRVYLSQDVLVVTNTHVIGDAGQRAGALVAAPVSVGDGCWVGARTTILPGVHIGAGSIVAAGSVVVDDVRPGTLVAGVPAREVRQLDAQPDLAALPYVGSGAPLAMR